MSGAEFLYLYICIFIIYVYIAMAYILQMNNMYYVILKFAYRNRYWLKMKIFLSATKLYSKNFLINIIYDEGLTINNPNNISK